MNARSARYSLRKHVLQILSTVAVLSASAVVFQNCSQGNLSNSSEASSSPLSFAGNAVINQGQLLGTWTSACQVSGQQGAILKTEFSSGGSVAILMTIYFSTLCNLAVATVQLNGSYTLGSQDPAVPGSTTLNLSLEPEAMVLVNNSVLSGSADQSPFCELTNAQPNVTEYVSVNNSCLLGLGLLAGGTPIALSGTSLYLLTDGNAIMNTSAPLQFVSSQTPDILAALTLGPVAAEVSPGQFLQLVASGGAAPYVYTLLTGSGTLDSQTGSYLAPAATGTATVQVTDSEMNMAQLTIQIGTANLSGTFSGTESGTVNGHRFTQTVTLTLTQTGTYISGTFDDGNGNTGTISGTVNGNQIGSFSATNGSNNPCGSGSFTGTAALVGTTLTASLQGSASVCGATAGTLTATLSN